ncbi:hypothetical protein GCM10011519_06890 [Marmoricola endophyticus]|uniref:Endolytic murein transglycosylase n=1 Tax=Marmoricola endophyticus TaxID=2040280 RepID=A0A917BEE8_9ACTN|nr:endolytic transglycosylase MltG [Marmoricola endophyticus]GGF36004.1 hypothetical protein GCM10011519_06890 [Marmoricola endophyticus]
MTFSLMGPEEDHDAQSTSGWRRGDDGRMYDDEGTDYYQRFTRGEGAGRGGGGRRGPGRSRRPRWVPALVLAVIAVLVIGVGYVGVGKLRDRFGPGEDYAGPGSGSVVFQVAEGDTASDMAPELVDRGVVASSKAFLSAARKDERSSSIQVGFYPLKEKMSSQQALDVLVDPKNQVQQKVTIPEGARLRDIVQRITKATDFSTQEVAGLLAEPSQIGLPAAAGGNPEGYLYPATYVVTPDTTAKSLLRQMVAKSVQVEDDLDLAAKARAKNLTVEQVITVASILEYEANRSEDYPKVARVIYNRLANDMPLQLDSTVSYVSGRSGDVWTTASERDSDSQYNTYKNQGLPPGPIGSPGQETVEAALNPAKGSWLYFVPDFATNTTLFSDTLAEHEKNVAKPKEYCRTHDSC